MITITNENFEALVLKSEVPVLIDFNADWCGPCQAQKPALEELEAESDGNYKIASINIDDEPDLAEKYEITSIPCLVLIKNGEEVDRKIGLQSKSRLKKLLGVK